MAIFNFIGIRIAAMVTAMPSNEVCPDNFKEQFGVEEVEKFKKMTGVISSRKASYHQTTGDLGYAAAEHLIKEKKINKVNHMICLPSRNLMMRSVCAACCSLCVTNLVLTL